MHMQLPQLTFCDDSTRWYRFVTTTGRTVAFRTATYLVSSVQSDGDGRSIVRLYNTTTQVEEEVFVGSSYEDTMTDIEQIQRLISEQLKKNMHGVHSIPVAMPASTIES